MAIEKEYTLKLTTKQAQENVDELNKSLEAQADLIDDIEKEIIGYEKQLKKTSKADLAGRKSLNDKIKITKERLKDEKVALKDVNKEKKKANETLKESTANSKDYSGVLGIIDQKTGGAISGFTKLTSSVGGATKGFNLMKVAIIGTGIGALLIALTSLSAAFTSSEEGQNKFAKIMAVIGSVVDNVVTLMSDLGLMIISAFENPQKAIEDFSKLIKDNIVNRFEGLLELLPALGNAVSLLFKGEFAEAGKVAANAVGKVALGVEDVVGKTEAAISATKDFIDEIVKEGKIAGQIADQRAKADKLDRDLIIERANANRDRADLLNKAADRENKNVQEKIGFLKEAGQIEEDITNKEIAAAQLRLQAKIAENEQANSTKDDLLEEANLKARLIDLETAKLRKAKMVTTQIATLNSEARATEAAEDAAQVLKDKEKDAAKLEAAKNLADLKKQIKDAEAVSEDERRALELEKIRTNYEALILAAEENNIVTDELKAARDEMLLEKQLQFDEQDAARKQSLADAEKAIAEQKIAMQNKVLDDLIAIGGAETKFGQAMLIAKQLLLAKELIMSIKKTLFKAQAAATDNVIEASGAAVSTASGAAKTASVGFPQNIPLIIGYAAQAAGIISAIKKAMSAAKTATKGVGPPAPDLPTPTPGSSTMPPAFNIVGQSDTNQLADAIGGQEQQPIQAFVVSSEVTTAQELDRNIIDGASIG